MKYGSVCSGIEAASVAWHDLGWEAQWFCEFDKFPSAVLDYRYPNIPNLGDMTKIGERKEYHERTINLLVGGTPCQSFSIAGLRKGLDDDRGNLALKFGEILAEKRPRWFIWENVPGVLSSSGGQDFATFLGLVCGRNIPVPREGWKNSGIIKGYENAYGIAFRTLDAQYFGVPQRRRRVFVVGYIGDWRPAAAVLFEQDSLHGNPTPSRKKGQRIAPSVTTGPPFSRTGNDRVETEAIVIDRAAFNQGENALYEPRIEESETMSALVARSPHAVAYARETAHCLQTTCDDYSRADGFNMVVHGTQDPDVLDDMAHTLGRNGGQENAIYTAKLGHTQSNGIGISDEGAYTLEATKSANQAVSYGMAVRRLTPVETELLQGFPRNWTKIPYRGKDIENCPDGPRYQACGNSMAVPCMKWLGQRIKTVDELL